MKESQPLKKARRNKLIILFYFFIFLFVNSTIIKYKIFSYANSYKLFNYGMPRDTMVTVKVSKRKRMRSKMFLKRSVPFLIVSMLIVLGGLVLIGNFFSGSPNKGKIQWVWFIATFLGSQFIYLKYIAEK